MTRNSVGIVAKTVISSVHATTTVFRALFQIRKPGSFWSKMRSSRSTHKAKAACSWDILGKWFWPRYVAVNLGGGCGFLKHALDLFLKPVTKSIASQDGEKILVRDSIECLLKV